MQKPKKSPDLDPSEVPEHILAALDNPQLVGFGNSENPSGADIERASGAQEEWKNIDYEPMAAGRTRPVFELVLLAVIEGHFGTEDPGDNKRRLRDAMKALTGKSIFESPLMDLQKDSVIRLAAKVRDRGHSKFLAKFSRATGANAGETSEPSLTRLSQEVVAEERQKRVADLDNADISYAKEILEKYTGTYYRKQRRDLTAGLSKKNFMRRWQHAFFEHDDIAESIEQQNAERILAELGKCGVRYRR